MKDPTLEQFLEEFTFEMFGRSAGIAHATKSCVSCGGSAIEFRDAISVKEYGISKMCQKCQDSVFNAPEE